MVGWWIGQVRNDAGWATIPLGCKAARFKTRKGAMKALEKQHPDLVEEAGWVSEPRVRVIQMTPKPKGYYRSMDLYKCILRILEWCPRCGVGNDRLRPLVVFSRPTGDGECMECSFRWPVLLFPDVD